MQPAAAAPPSPPPSPPQQHPPSVQHIFFLKTHKTGSTTMYIILAEYCRVHQLVPLMPKRGNCWLRINDLDHFVNRLRVHHKMFKNKSMVFVPRLRLQIQSDVQNMRAWLLFKCRNLIVRINISRRTY